MANNKKTIGTFIELGGTGVIQALTRVGLDYIIIDTEHCNFSEETAEQYIIAAENGGLETFVRVGDLRRPYVLRMADIGARGLIVPHIHTADEVRELVSYTKFPPIGNRGYSPTRTSAWGTDDWAQDIKSYMEESNRRCKIIPQCETIEAFESIEEIAAIPGVDGIFVGPCDLSIEMGIPLEFENPKLHEAINRILKACKDNGKEAYIFSGSMDNAVSWIEKGFDSVAYGLDAGFLINAYKGMTETFRNRTEGK